MRNYRSQRAFFETLDKHDSSLMGLPDESSRETRILGQLAY